jgi:hypothetical protein
VERRKEKERRDRFIDVTCVPVSREPDCFAFLSIISIFIFLSENHEKRVIYYE